MTPVGAIWCALATAVNASTPFRTAEERWLADTSQLHLGSAAWPRRSTPTLSLADLELISSTPSVVVFVSVSIAAEWTAAC